MIGWIISLYQLLDMENSNSSKTEGFSKKSLQNAIVSIGLIALFVWGECKMNEIDKFVFYGSLFLKFQHKTCHWPMEST